MDTQKDPKDQILKRILSQVEDPDALTKNSNIQSFVFLVIALITILALLMFFGFTEEKEYLMMLLVWLSGVSIGTVVILRSSMSQWEILRGYIDKDKMRADLENRDNT